jgi:Tfp pilus assembly protein FimV
LDRLATLREEAGDREGAETLYRQAIDHGHPFARDRLAELLEKAGDKEGAETLARQAADHGHTYTLAPGAELPEIVNRLWPYGLDPDGTPTGPWDRW